MSLSVHQKPLPGRVQKTLLFVRLIPPWAVGNPTHFSADGILLVANTLGKSPKSHPRTVPKNKQKTQQKRRQYKSQAKVLLGSTIKNDAFQTGHLRRNPHFLRYPKIGPPNWARGKKPELLWATESSS